MTTDNPSRVERLRRGFDKVAPILWGFCCIAVIMCSVGVYIEARTNRAQDRQRIADNEQFTGCLLGVVKQLAGNGPPVRTATQKRDNATRAIVLDLFEVVRLASAHQKATPTLKTKFASDLASYLADDDGVTAARKANPYPSSPTKLCQFSVVTQRP